MFELNRDIVAAENENLSSATGTFTWKHASFIYNPSSSSRTITVRVDAQFLNSPLETAELLATGGAKVVGYVSTDGVLTRDSGTPFMDASFSESDIVFTTVTGTGAGGRADLVTVLDSGSYKVSTITVDIAGDNYSAGDTLDLELTTTVTGDDGIEYGAVRIQLLDPAIADAEFSFSLGGFEITPMPVVSTLYNQATAAKFIALVHKDVLSFS